MGIYVEDKVKLMKTIDLMVSACVTEMMKKHDTFFSFSPGNNRSDICPGYITSIHVN